MRVTASAIGLAVRVGYKEHEEFRYLCAFLVTEIYRVILSVLDPRKCEYLKDYSLDFEHAYMTTYLAS